MSVVSHEYLNVSDQAVGVLSVVSWRSRAPHVVRAVVSVNSAGRADSEGWSGALL